MSRVRPLIGLSGLSIFALLGLGIACDERGGASTVIPTGGGGGDSQLKPEGEFEGESIDELDLRLERLTEEHEARIAAGTNDPSECEALCELSQAICEVKTKMCEIADDRVSDSEYQMLCRKAKQRCEQASDSCVRCVEHNQDAASAGAEAGSSCAGEPER
ncbi:hypothetical protein G6O69_19500 [Pseudenhygromyxa sp. WMMC2535]|uniref:hypothetical protein n=1 Tax=Pseudenhygromyxa sp. WMMC2535 TaxID=2712867 RepID=UPI0015561B8E|nr:hypothetical protein [Pseudenhygromyxa sp. WMMC2535]NVB40040.1 hypothetical protein [Pseudenhygromyxa sp. WMMC2535]